MPSDSQAAVQVDKIVVDAAQLLADLLVRVHVAEVPFLKVRAFRKPVVPALQDRRQNVVAVELFKARYAVAGFQGRFVGDDVIDRR